MKKHYSDEELLKKIALADEKRWALAKRRSKIEKQFTIVIQEMGRLRYLLRQQCQHVWNKPWYDDDTVWGVKPLMWRRSCKKCAQEQFSYQKGKAANWQNIKK